MNGELTPFRGVASNSRSIKGDTALRSAVPRLQSAYFGRGTKEAIPHARSLIASGWLIAGIFVLILHYWGALPLLASVQCISILCLALGVWGFLHHGGPQITAAGYFMAGSGAFVGYAGLWWTNGESSVISSSFLGAVCAGYFTTIFLYFGMWWGTHFRVEPSVYSSESCRRAMIFGFALGAISILAHTNVPESLDQYTRAAAIVGILILAIGVAADGPTRHPLSWVSQLALAILLVVFVAVIFSGLGRLVVVVLFAGVALLFAERRSSRRLKLLGLAAVPVLTTLLSLVRIDRVAGYTQETVEGGDSDVGGIRVFAELLEMRGDWDLGWGETFLSTLLIWVPRELWEGKPVGFGFELTLLLRPELASVGHSMVATAFGEWYYNFAWLGMPLMVLVVGIVIRWVDRRRAGASLELNTEDGSVILHVLYVLLSALVLQFVWGGAFSAASRLLLPGALLVLMYGASWVFTRRMR